MLQRCRTIIGNAVVFALAIAATTTACGSGARSYGELGEHQQILASCDPARQPASLIEIDGTGSSASEQITAERMAAIESVARTTAICSGRLRVILFSASSAATVTLFDGPLPLHGATDNARLKRVPQVVGEVMATIRQAYAPAVAALPGGGSDITSQLRLASEWISQLGGDFRLHLYLFTDGLDTVRAKSAAQALSKQRAAALADRTAVPNLPEASVTVARLGRVAGAPPRSEVVEGLVAYYDALCRRTGASDCLAVTDYATESR
jgi:hypothetical protein